ncbi:MAG: MATE family efflux transporter [Candidatus Altiarchaeales archaeon]|nr:MATE family efflux transporter [Candidatus Altiarchaeales archaeon]MBD3416658.1 MATE family efflux transporter [Candidatus Altiarchaeales archaeon]
MGKDLTEGNISRTIIETSVPLMVAFVLQSAFNIADAFFVGKISAEALAAVSISFPVVFLIIALGTGIGAGTTSVVARYIGAKDYDNADNAAEHALISSGFVGLGLGIAGFLISPYLFDIIGAEGSLKALALEYINILLFFTVFMMFAFVGNSILRGEGDMKTPMKIMGLSSILNIVFDPFFIFPGGYHLPFGLVLPFGLGLGVRGAAIATLTARGIGMSWLTWHILTGRSWVKLDFRHFRYDFSHVKNIFFVGVPASLINVTMSVGMFLWTVIVGMHGTAALAAYGIGFRLDTVALLPAMGVSVAVISIVGQNIGAGKLGRARQATYKAGMMASGFMVFIGILFNLFSVQIISAFNTDPEVVGYGVSFLRIIPWSYIFVGLAMCISSAFVGSGQALLALLITIMRIIVFSVPLAYLISLAYGVSGIWMGIAAGSILGSLFALLLFKRCCTLKYTA